MSIDFEMKLDFGMLTAQMEAVAPIALTRAAEAVRGVAVSRAADDTGHLRGEAGVTAEFKAVEVTGAGLNAVADLKFPGPYAAYHNRGMRADGTHIIRNHWHGGEAGFLTKTMVDQKPLALAMLADSFRQLLGN